MARLNEIPAFLRTSALALGLATLGACGGGEESQPPQTTLSGTVAGHVPLFLTVSKGVGERAKELGAGHLLKPVMVDELLQTVAQFAPAARAASSAPG